ncbi:hypothetical protein [Eubacterium xylanophilum]|uniref:hypothetical protein n=1 Tax=Eubacterium xylanophilum TaxID=39497 RepID=UPI00047BD21E|nr:hypothetical protein [Eubacterium xylanophilum]
MKRYIRRSVATTMALVIATVTSLINVNTINAKSPSETTTEKGGYTNPDGNLYISDLKVAYDYDYDNDRDSDGKDNGVRDLEAEGYTVLRGPNGDDEDGNGYADLNVDAGGGGLLKKGPNDMRVYLGYKTTKDPSKAITDIAVMNMKGGYDVQEYNLLMERTMESSIKPFVDKFITTIEEYRKNYKKPAKTLNHIRANYMRCMLNKLTDDDTGGQPLGDLLLNKTKYEMGDDEYNKLSDSEKKKHADILTILMQGNAQAIFTMELLLSRATDTSKDSWTIRMDNNNLASLRENIEKNNPSISSQEDIDRELDKKYYDTAQAIKKKWSAFRSVIFRVEDNRDEIEENIDELANKETEGLADSLDVANQAQALAIYEYLNNTDYDDGTLLEFFSKKESEISGKDGIRELYPMAASLSPGQISGLEFLTMMDLISIAMTGEEGYSIINEKEMETASVYDGINREIYEKGGVGLTNAALRQKAAENAEKDGNGSLKFSDITIVMYSITGALCLATALGVMAVTSVRTSVDNILADAEIVASPDSGIGHYVEQEYFDAANQSFFGDAFAVASRTLLIAAAVAAVVSIYFTIRDLMDYYNCIDYSTIPKYMVEEMNITMVNERGEKILKKNETAYYQAVQSNRKKMHDRTPDSDWNDLFKAHYDAMGDFADLNGDVGKQWLALYTVKYKDAAPILADSLKIVTGTKTAKAPSDDYSTGIHMFGEKTPFNLNSEQYDFNDTMKGYFVWFKTDKRTVAEMTGSVFSKGSLALAVGVGIVFGGILGACIVISSKRRKKKIEVA